MKLINGIHIKYFRSLYDINFTQISDTLTVFTGANDVGKSNVLRALNLFFNNETDVEEQILFERDFSKIRRKEIKEKIKTRQLIQITLEINSPSEYKSLPKSFKVSRRFDRYNEESDFIFENQILSNKKRLAAARRLINSIRFTYIPAIRDKDTFVHVLQDLKSHLPPLEYKEVTKFNQKLQNYGEELKQDFLNKINLMPILSLPETAKELFSTFDFFIKDDILSTSLAQRGDGVRCRFIPSIMNYIAKHSNHRHIWAIEEPENSLEFLKALELHDTLEKEYSKTAQIFVTSHSPAFVGDIAEKSNKVIYFLDKDDNGKISCEKIDRNLLLDEQKISLSQRLGYISLQKELADCLKKKIEETQKIKQEYETLTETIRTTSQSFILFVEGETDKIILENAWKKLYSSQIMPFYINICYADTQIKALLQRLEIHNFEGKTFIGLWDFDCAYSQWDGTSKTWENKSLNENEGLLRKKQNEPKYAMLLPVPKCKSTYASKELGDRSALSIEFLFPEDKISQYTHPKICVGGGKIMEFNKSQKIKFAQETASFSKEDFIEFQKIFKIIMDIQKEKRDD